MSHKWTLEDMPDQTGKIAIVTGANGGLGYETTLALARKNARVVMACRNLEKAEKAEARIKKQYPAAALKVLPLDLGRLDSVRAFAAAFKEAYTSLHILINNAGVMAPPRQETADGFEMQFGINHLGHFALTGLLLDVLVKTPGSRVVTVSSTAQFMGRINFDDLQHQEKYSRYRVYGQSKLANVMFAYELQRRLEAAGITNIRSLAAHPGYSATDLQETAADSSGSTLENLVYKFTNTVIAQSAAMGALPQLYAATAPEAEGGTQIAPSFLQTRGYPVVVKGAKAARKKEDAARLWEISESLTGVTYDLPDAG